MYVFFYFYNRPKRKPKDLKLIIPPRNNYFLDAGSSDIPFIEIKREIRNLRSNRMALDTEDSGIVKADDMSAANRADIVIPNSPRVPPEGAEMDIQIDQLRPHNQQQYRQEDSVNNQNNAKQLSINFRGENKCQASPSATNSTTNVSFIDINIEDATRSNRLSPQRGGGSGVDSSSQSINQYGSQLETQHHTILPFSNTTYAAFKKGNVVRGILCPSFTNSFRYVEQS